MSQVKEAQLNRVLMAFESGSRTTSEVAVLTGLLPKSCAAYARLLVARGLLIDRGAYRPMGRGRPTRWYEPASSVPVVAGRSDEVTNTAEFGKDKTKNGQA